MNSDDVVPPEWKEPIRRLHRSLREGDAKRSFDRCSVGGEGCKQPSIEAHTVPMTTLKLIADQTNKVICSSATPPTDPVSYVFQQPLATRSIRAFSVGRWSCKEHDELFKPVDSTDIDFANDYELFLTIYRVTLRATQLTLHGVERWATTVLDPVSRPTGFSEPYLGQLRNMARTSSFTAVRLLFLKTRMDKLLKEQRFDELEYRVVRWETTPVLAGAGMRFFDGPGASVSGYGSDLVIPAWIVLLPQQYGQAVVVASIRGMDRHVHELYSGIPKNRFEPSKKTRRWTKAVSNKVLENAIDIAVSVRRYEQLTMEEIDSLQGYLHARSIHDIKLWKLPNLAYMSQ